WERFVYCTACGTPQPEHARFCTACGRPLGLAAPAPPLLAGPPAASLASFGSRAVALIIDWTVLGVALVAGTAVAGVASPGADSSGPGSSLSGLGWLVFLATMAACLSYPVFCEGRAAGQTLGKRAM